MKITFLVSLFWLLHYVFIFILLRKFFFLSLLTVLHGMCYLSSPSRDWTHAPLHWQQNLNHWITREVPRNIFWSMKLKEQWKVLLVVSHLEVCNNLAAISESLKLGSYESSKDEYQESILRKEGTWWSILKIPLSCVSSL